MSSNFSQAARLGCGVALAPFQARVAFHRNSLRARRISYNET